MTVCVDILIEVRIEHGAEFRQVQMAVDAAELVICFEHPGGAPAQRHLPRHRLTFLDCSGRSRSWTAGRRSKRADAGPWLVFIPRAETRYRPRSHAWANFRHPTDGAAAWTCCQEEHTLVFTGQREGSVSSR